MSDLDPNRKVLFAGDAWAQPGAQIPIPETVKLLRITTGEPLRYRVTGYTNTGPNGAPVDGDLSTANTTVVKIRTDRRGNTTLARTVPSGLVATGEQLTEEDVSANELVAIGVVAAVQDTAAALWIDIDAGATKVGS